MSKCCYGNTKQLTSLCSYKHVSYSRKYCILHNDRKSINIMTSQIILAHWSELIVSFRVIFHTIVDIMSLQNMDMQLVILFKSHTKVQKMQLGTFNKQGKTANHLFLNIYMYRYFSFLHMQFKLIFLHKKIVTSLFIK